MTPPNLHELSDNTALSRGWLYAHKIHPTSELVDTRCDKCGRGSVVPSGGFDVDLEGGSKFPDILLCGAHPFLLVSERVMADWHKSGINTFDAHSVRVISVKSAKAPLTRAPQYFRIEITGRCSVNSKASQMTISRQCSKCGRGYIDRDNHNPFAIAAGSWDGSPLFRDLKLLPRVSFCAQVVADLAMDKKHTNFQFKPAVLA